MCSAERRAAGWHATGDPAGLGTVGARHAGVSCRGDSDERRLAEDAGCRVRGLVSRGPRAEPEALRARAQVLAGAAAPELATDPGRGNGDLTGTGFSDRAWQDHGAERSACQ